MIIALEMIIIMDLEGMIDPMIEIMMGMMTDTMMTTLIGVMIIPIDIRIQDL